MFSMLVGVVEQRRSDGGSTCNQGRGPADRGGSSQMAQMVFAQHAQAQRHHMHPVIPSLRVSVMGDRTKGTTLERVRVKKQPAC
jgi:hypothetical protein